MNGEKESCFVCTKTVYPTERVAADEKVYHKTCFRCKECNGVLKLGSFASMEGEVFCKPCFKKLFFSKGNYSEGFGKLKPQQEHDLKTGKKVDPDPDAPVSSPSPVEEPAHVEPDLVKQEAKTPKKEEPPKDPVASSPVVANSSGQSGPVNPTQNRCNACDKTVYSMEEVKADNQIFHKGCFRCKECSGVLKLGSFAAMEGQFYCKPCFKKLFFSKGNYSSGFGKLKPQEEHDLKTGKAPSVAYSGSFKGVEMAKTDGSAEEKPVKKEKPEKSIVQDKEESEEQIAKRKQLEEQARITHRAEQEEEERAVIVRRAEQEEEQKRVKQEEQSRAKARKQELADIEEKRKLAGQQQVEEELRRQEESSEAQKDEQKRKQEEQRIRILRETEEAKKREQAQEDKVAKEKAERKRIEQLEMEADEERRKKQVEEAGEFKPKSDVKFTKPAAPGRGPKKLIKKTDENDSSSNLV